MVGNDDFLDGLDMIDSLDQNIRNSLNKESDVNIKNKKDNTFGISQLMNNM